MKCLMTNRTGFTLVELLAVMLILSMLMGLIFPNLQRATQNAQSIACAANLRTIGTAVQLYIQDNENSFPIIEGYPTNPIYPSDQGVGGMLDVLGPYDIEAKNLRCPTDMQKDRYFLSEGSSYMWNPIADGENQNAVTIYGRRVHLLKSLVRLSLCSDFTSPSGVGPHNGKVNTLYADGHVVNH